MNSATSRRFGYWTPMVFATVFALLGLLLAAGGLWLITLGGSWYYLPAGIGSLILGVLLWRSRLAGIWLY